jgi:hypothetical protein
MFKANDRPRYDNKMRQLVQKLPARVARQLVQIIEGETIKRPTARALGTTSKRVPSGARRAGGPHGKSILSPEDACVRCPTQGLEPFL